MKMPDANILIYDHQEDMLLYDLYKSWILDLLNGSEPFAISSLVTVAFLRKLKCV